MAGTPQAASRDEDLGALRARIEALQAELDRKESSRRESRDALRASETALSDINRALRELDARSRDAATRLRDAEARRREAEGALSRAQGAVEGLLVATYASRAPGALKLALQGEDPAEAARRLHYAAILSGAASRAFEEFRSGLRDLEQARRAAADEAGRVEEVERQRRAERERALAERRERQQVMDRLALELRHGRREMRVMQADEARLSRIIEEIGRALAPRPAPGPGGRAAARSPAAADGTPFSKLRGRLQWPVRGELAARFGAQPGDGTGSRKGVFLRSPAGEAVRAVGAGRVVFADWMRGFGNVLIVDHGESYLSVYGNNESLLKRAGDAVGAGDAVATVGATGGNEETGLYFELRHLGKAFDPSRWIGR